LAETLFIRLIDDGTAAWAAFDGNGALASPVGRGPLAGAASELAGRRCCVLVPAVDVTSAHLELPAASQARLRQIVPFSLEESLADDIEQLAFAIGTRGASGATPVAVVAKQKVEAWLAQLRAAGIVPHMLCSEADGVPDLPGTLVLLVEAGRIYGRHGGRAPFVLDGLTLPQALEVVHEPGEQTNERHLLVYAEPADREHVRDVVSLRDEFASVQVKVAAEGVFAHLAATLAQRPGTNFLQGAYAPKSNWAAFARPWRFAAALLIATATLLFVSQGAQYWQLRRADRELADVVATTCQRIVGDARPSVCQREVQQRLGASAASGSSEDFLTTLAAIAAARDPQMRIDGLSYRNRVMDLQLMAASVPALDEFARGLEQTKRFAAEIQAANQRDDGTEGRVRVTDKTP
jgi:general secretion pathway protein L